MEQASSSKVTVEYHDPSGVFPLVSRDIASRLPLRNLNWQSHARPLRQIRSLHVEFVPDVYTQETLRAPLTRLDSQEATSIDLARAGADARRPNTVPGKERRHQIPGLKTSPYLKIYVLRCDDKDTYKASERKRLREWIRDNAPPEGKREKHDTFEWMILHVVVPDTVAASEPRWRESSHKESDEFKERSKSNVKWPGKSTRTVFDKLRADFNESSKSAPDRVAQIRLLKNSVPPDLLPTPAIASTLEESPQERENAWADLVTKFKTLILIPFDARVRQYEEDIAEQESRRSLPGWNFCTFFIHKEGLAKALESVGLVEDALAIYDELSLGLETVIRDLASGNAEGTATSFEDTTKDFQERILRIQSTSLNGTAKNDRKSGLFDKDYREQIVRSQISVFDFFCYLFSRQKALILRLAGAQLAQHEFGSNFKEGGEDLVLLAEVCWRALSFTHNSGRTLRQDLINGSKSNALSRNDVEALVCSWTFSLVGQVLEETTSALLDTSDESMQAPKPQSHNAKPKRQDFGFAMGANPYPSRTSSLGMPQKRPPPPVPQSPPPAEKTYFEVGTYGPKGIMGGEEMKLPDIPGVVELAAYRAELIMIRRKMIELLAKKKGWVAGWVSIRLGAKKKVQDVDLRDDGRNESSSEGDGAATKAATASTLVTPALADYLKNETAFRTVFEELSSTAIRHYTIATHMKSAEKVLGDVAILRFQQRDFFNAAKYFEHVLPLYGQTAWGMMEVQAVEIFLTCLQELGRKEEWTRIAVGYLGKVAAGRMGGRKTSEVEADEMKGLLGRLIEISSGLDHVLEVKMDHFLDDIELDHKIEHLDDRDGFQYRFRFRHVLDDDVVVDEVSARLVRLDDPQTEIWLTSPTPLSLNTGTVSAELVGTVTTLGAFYVDKIILKAKNFRLTHDFSPEPEKLGLGITIPDPNRTEATQLIRTVLLLYPPARAFDAQVDLARDIQIDKPRHLRIKLSSGWNVIEKLDLRLKPASAGLRLHVADARTFSIDRNASTDSAPGLLSLSTLAADSEAYVDIPYTLEQATTEIVLRLEARYTTATGTFAFFKAIRLPVVLPLDVDVNDLFQHDALFSTFTVRTTNHCPVSIHHAELVESKAYAIEKASVEILPTTVFEKAPVSLVYKITRKSDSGKVTKKDAPLALAVQYQPVEEIVLGSLTRNFTMDLLASEFRNLRRLLVPLLDERMRAKMSVRDLEMAILLGEAKVPDYNVMGWCEILSTLPEGLQESLEKWLLDWHSKHVRVGTDVADSANTEAEERKITLAVDVPTLDVVFSTQIALQGADELQAECVVKVGQAIKAEIKIRHSRLWSDGRIFGAEEGEQIRRGKFVFDVQAEPDVWLLGGPKRKHFELTSTPNENEEAALTFPLTLVPLKVGELAMPGVDVQVAGSEDGDEKAADEAVSCETVSESAGVVIKVVRGLVTARVRIVEGISGAET